MALNCSMITPTNDPIPLPGEKFFISVKSVTIYLNPTKLGAGTTSEPSTSPLNTSAPKMKGKLSLSGIFSAISFNPKDGSADGTIYVTNQRILFVADMASDLPDPSNPTSSTSIKTLTVPLRNSFDGRFIQPWLSPNYHLSTFTPVPNGNLDQLLSATGTDAQSSSAHDSFTLKVVFNEGHGFEFYEALEEVKNRLYLNEGQSSAELEELPIYSPPACNSMLLDGVGGPSTIPQDVADMSNVGITNDLPPPIDELASREFLRRNTVPEDDLLLAASIATQEELQERVLVTEEPPMITVADSQPLTSNPAPNADAPPVYEP